MHYIGIQLNTTDTYVVFSNDLVKQKKLVLSVSVHDTLLLPLLISDATDPHMHNAYTIHTFSLPPQNIQSSTTKIMDDVQCIFMCNTAGAVYVILMRHEQVEKYLIAATFQEAIQHITPIAPANSKLPQDTHTIYNKNIVTIETDPLHDTDDIFNSNELPLGNSNEMLEELHDEYHDSHDNNTDNTAIDYIEDIITEPKDREFFLISQSLLDSNTTFNTQLPLPLLDNHEKNTASKTIPHDLFPDITNLLQDIETNENKIYHLIQNEQKNYTETQKTEKKRLSPLLLGLIILCSFFIIGSTGIIVYHMLHEQLVPTLKNNIAIKNSNNTIIIS